MPEKKKYVLTLSTVPDLEAGRTIARALVEEHLAACVNIVPSIQSIFEWEGKIQEGGELLLLIKTRSDLVQSLTQKILEIHPYDCPEVIALEIRAGSRAYLDWIDEVVRQDGHVEDGK